MLDNRLNHGIIQNEMNELEVRDWRIILGLIQNEYEAISKPDVDIAAKYKNAAKDTLEHLAEKIKRKLPLDFPEYSG